MAKGRAKVSSKQSTGPKRQRELLSSSRCRVHNKKAVTTKLLPGGKYIHKCDVCYVTPEVVTIKPGNNTATLLHLILRGR